MVGQALVAACNTVSPDHHAHSLHCYFLRGGTCALMILSFQTDRSGQTVQAKIRLVLEGQSDLGLHCLLFHLHLFDETP